MALKRRRLCSGSWRMVIPWECILTATSIKNSMNRWIVSQKISHGSETISTRRPVWKASIIVFRGAAPIRSAILICMNLLIIWTVRAWNILTGMCPPEMAEAGICLSIPCWRIVQRILIPGRHRSYCCMTLRRNRLRWKHYRIS